MSHSEPSSSLKPAVFIGIVASVIISALVVALVISLQNNNGSNASNMDTAPKAQVTNEGAPIQNSQNPELQSCINAAHDKWDMLVASGNDIPDTPNYAKSNLDTEIAQCHQEYGY